MPTGVCGLVAHPHTHTHTRPAEIRQRHNNRVCRLSGTLSKKNEIRASTGSAGSNFGITAVVTRRANTTGKRLVLLYGTDRTSHVNWNWKPKLAHAEEQANHGSSIRLAAHRDQRVVVQEPLLTAGRGLAWLAGPPPT